jgi:hypothetical protein
LSLKGQEALVPLKQAVATTGQSLRVKGVVQRSDPRFIATPVTVEVRRKIDGRDAIVTSGSVMAQGEAGRLEYELVLGPLNERGNYQLRISSVVDQDAGEQSDSPPGKPETRVIAEGAIAVTDLPQ